MFLSSAVQYLSPFFAILGPIVWSPQTGTWHWSAFVVPLSDLLWFNWRILQFFRLLGTGFWILLVFLYFVIFWIFSVFENLSFWSPVVNSWIFSISRISCSGWFLFCAVCRFGRQQTTMYTPGPCDQRPLPPSTPQHSTPPTQPHPTASQPHPTTFFSRPLTRPHTLTTYHNTLETRMHGPSKTTLSQRVSPSTAGEMEDAVQARTSNTRNTASTRSGDTGGKGQTTLVRVNEGGRRNRWVHIFEVCRLFFSLREGDYIDWRYHMLDVSFELRGIFGMHVAVLCLCPCVSTARGFTSLPTGGGV